MKNEFLIATIVLLILILFILFVINSLCLEVANQIKHDSEKLFNSYNEVLDKITKKEVENIPVSEVKKVEEKTVYVLRESKDMPAYKDPEIFGLYNAINFKFNVNEEKIIKEFDTTNNDCYYHIKKMNDLLNENDRVFKIATLKPSSQVKVMKEIIDQDKDLEMFLDYLNDKKFNIIKFKEEVEYLLLNNNRNVTVFTSNKDDLAKSDDKIHYVYDDRIVVGVQCLQANKLYDYAIERKEVC